MKFIVATKIGMSQIFNEDGTVTPVTLLKSDLCQVTQLKSKEKDGYVAAKIGYRKAAKEMPKALKGQSKAIDGTTFRSFIELRDEASLNVGDKLDVSSFVPGEFVHITGTSKGKGFQGVVKRHHFRGGPASHGHKDNLRMPGSIGSGGMQRVFKGLRMGGRMGGEKVTVKNLRVVAIDAATGVLSVKGAVPGALGAHVFVYEGAPKKMSWN